MAFLGPVTGGSRSGTGFLNAPSAEQTDARKKQAEAAAQEEINRQAAEQERKDNTVLGSRTLGTARNFLKSFVDPAIGAVATPALRLSEATAYGIGKLTGNEGVKERALNEELPLPSPLGGKPIPIAPQRGFDQGGGKQIVGDTLKYAATVYPGTSVEKAAGSVFLGKIGKAAAESAVAGGISGGAYGVGEGLSDDNSYEEALKKGLTYGGIGLGLGGVLGAAGAGIAAPGARRASAEAEATRLRPLKVEDANEYLPNPKRIEIVQQTEEGKPGEFWTKRSGADEGYGSIRKTAYVDPTKLYKGTSSRDFIEERGLLTDDVQRQLDDALESDDPNLEYKITQDIARAALKKEGYPGAHWTYEDDLNPTQYQIWDKSVVQGKAKPAPATAQPTVRKLLPLPVENQSARARSVPINRAQEPHIPEAELPVIPYGPKAKETLPTIQTRPAASRAKGDISYEPVRPEAVPVAPKAPQVAPKVTKQAPASTERGTPATVPSRPVDMTRQPRSVARPEVRTVPGPKGETTVSKAASDVNRKLAEKGIDSLPEDQLARINSISKEDQLDKVAKLLDGPDADAMAVGDKEIPRDVAPQVLFNAVKQRADETGNWELQKRLAQSPIATERAAAAQTLGSAGFNNGPADAVNAIADLQKVREKAATRRKQPTDVKKEAKTADTAIKKASKRTWDSVVDSLTC